MGLLSRQRYFVAPCAIQCAALLAVLLPFLRSNLLLEWDFPGHVAAVWHLKEHLLPWPSGWNPYFYAGYPQGIFYPPLAHYLAALLGLLIGIGPAIKALVAAGILLLPASFNFFARRAGLEDLSAAVASTWMTALLFVSGEMLRTWSLGADLQSALNVGLFANTVSMPLLFFFLGSCMTVAASGRWRGSALLLGLLILTHPLSSLVALLFLFCCLVAELASNKAWSKSASLLVRAALTGMAIGALWLLPFLAFRSHMNTESIGAQWSSAVMLIVLNGSLLSVAALSRKHLRALSIGYLFLANLILLGTMWRLELQFTRLTVFLLFLIPLFAISFIRSRGLLWLTALLAVIVGMQGYRRSGIRPEGVEDFRIPDFGRLEGRILSVAPPSHLPSYHVNHDPIPPATGNESILGLFIESSLNGRFAGNLVQLLEPEAYVWGTPTETVRPEWLGNDYPRYVLDRLRLFDIRHIYTDLRLEEILGSSAIRERRLINSRPVPAAKSPREAESMRRRYHVREGFLEFYLYTLHDGSPAEALAYLPASISTDWKLTSKHWFLEIRGVPIFSDRPIPAGVRPAQAGERVEFVPARSGMTRREYVIHSLDPVPVLLKTGYFPSWNASIDGKPCPIFRAPPNLMLVFGKGRLVLEYARSTQEILGILISLLGLAALAVPGAWGGTRKAPAITGRASSQSGIADES